MSLIVVSGIYHEICYKSVVAVFRIVREDFICSISMCVFRIDCFTDVSTSLFGEKLKEQVEERLRFYEEGIAPRKNTAAMEVGLHRLSTHKMFVMCSPAFPYV